MEKQKGQRKSQSQQMELGITRIIVSGYKSIAQEQCLEIRPLTILAGANSSGKSSIMQPLLLLKQTLEASYDPGPLLLTGPNVKFTSVDQMLSRTSGAKQADTLSVGISIGPTNTLTTCFKRQPNRKLSIERLTYYGDGQEEITFRPEMTHDEIMGLIPDHIKKLYEAVAKEAVAKEEKTRPEWAVVRDRCFLELEMKTAGGALRGISPTTLFEPHIREIIHVPGLRGNPARTYPVTAVGSTFPGTFESYAASVIAQWQTDRKDDRYARLSRDLNRMGLTWKVAASPVSDTEVELKVGRMTRAIRGGARDLVSIADVGFGVSQTLPVLVAIHASKPGQLLYLEQPEIHLHPRAQLTMAHLLADAANRGVRVIAETHSALLLLGVQSLVAEGNLSPQLVKLYWFTRRADGTTEVKGADLDKAGAFGDWPVDFGEVALEAESRYMDAAESRHRTS